jgi:hypothetical protein
VQRIRAGSVPIALPADGYSGRVPRPRRSWIQEERRRALGDWVAFCLRCGFTRRFFAAGEAIAPPPCPQCGGELRDRCPGCGALIASAFAVSCEGCGGALRDDALFGGPIRRRGR